ncbi:hypothetical protein MesoLj131c_22410 [Mesorhizobium sp. 131-3-5]|uniref:hypothetical protein n=1 Tax=unclassified Mesorhizobium TaxID=325217 RepID=UPI00192636F6|nr:MULTISPECIES: hypothetical protein [unclassified Mesorhizobium]BCH00296.1 hypothetical protein MesoLj131b_22950 [Mesorhizobium sp. 131-2-5]BCH07983.1 hypothetical protein MesoLj131c_22410 [Mesorhizobium sp. 131-3-5]
MRKIDKPDDATMEAQRAALEQLGAVFIEENGGGIGVRLKFTAAETRCIATAIDTRPSECNFLKKPR